MLSVLDSVLQNNLPAMLDLPEIWDSLIINRRKPYTYRLFAPLGKYRVCLHKFEPCESEEAFLHPHPWSAAFKVLKGSYESDIGWAMDRESQPATVFRVRFAAGSSYEITKPMVWHNVIPLEECYTVMVNDEPWPEWFTHKEVRTTKGKDLESMSREGKKVLLSLFKAML